MRVTPNRRSHSRAARHAKALIEQALFQRRQEQQHVGLLAAVAHQPYAPDFPLYRAEPALWEADADSAGFRFVDADNADDNVIAFLRIAPRSGRRLLCVCNFSPVVRQGYRVGVPAGGIYKEILNTDSELFGGGNLGNAGAVAAEPSPRHGFEWSLSLTLPPLAVLWFGIPDG